jgi:ankyrin repeat protein
VSVQQCMKLMLSSGANARLSDTEGNTALMWAAHYGGYSLWCNMCRLQSRRVPVAGKEAVLLLLSLSDPFARNAAGNDALIVDTTDLVWR